MTGSSEEVVLIVDDEDIVLSLLRRTLERGSYRVIEARDGLEAIDLFREQHKEIMGVILDLSMPRMNGEETFEALRAIDPEVRVILSSGFGEWEAFEQFGQRGLCGFLQKPFRPLELLKTVQTFFSEAK